MNRLDRLHNYVRHNLWLRYFTVFVRLMLAAGFIPAGIVKIMGERFASGLSVVHPMGSYLAALHNTGYYYTFIGVAQVTAGVLLLIPRTVLLGILIYLPIIVNICVLSFAVRFDGSLFTAPLMVLANIYILCWHWDRLKFILPFRANQLTYTPAQPETYDKRFPWKFFAFVGGAGALVLAVSVAISQFAAMPRNSMNDCRQQFRGTERAVQGEAFCACIHQQGESLEKCLAELSAVGR